MAALCYRKRIGIARGQNLYDDYDFDEMNPEIVRTGKDFDY